MENDEKEKLIHETQERTRTEERLKLCEANIKALREQMEKEYTPLSRFMPIEKIVTTAVQIILTTVLLALLGLIIAQSVKK